MPSVVVSAVSLGKRYRLGELKSADSIRDLSSRLVARLLRRTEAVPRSDQWLWAIKDLSFEVRQGEVLGIIGKNGAGKSTVLKLLSRITSPTEGHATLHGRVASLLEVGTGFHGDLTGRENVYLNAAVLGMSIRDTRQRFDEIVEFSGVERFLDTPVKRYSSGMYVRLAFAVAAHLDPDVLIVDEVLAVGDMEFQRRCLQRMRQVAGEGRTVIFVSHNMGSISALCHRVLLLEGGRAVIDGPPAEAVALYLERTRESSCGRIWADPNTAPGNERARLRGLSIHQDGVSGPTGEVLISRPIRIRIAYECVKEGTRLSAALWLRDRMGVDVLASSNHGYCSLTADEWSGRPHPAGTYVAECELPAYFLNDDLYSVTPIVDEAPNSTIALVEDAVSFTVLDDGAMRGEYTGRWIGTVRPRLAWNSRPAPDAEFPS